MLSEILQDINGRSRLKRDKAKITSLKIITQYHLELKTYVLLKFMYSLLT